MKSLLRITFVALLVGWALVLPVRADVDMMFWTGASSGWVDDGGSWYYGGPQFNNYGYNAGYGWVPNGGNEIAVIKNGGTAYFDDYSQNSFNWLAELSIATAPMATPITLAAPTAPARATSINIPARSMSITGSSSVTTNARYFHLHMEGGVLNYYGGGGFQIGNGGAAVMTMSNNAVANLNGGEFDMAEWGGNRHPEHERNLAVQFHLRENAFYWAKRHCRHQSEWQFGVHNLQPPPRPIQHRQK